MNGDTSTEYWSHTVALVALGLALASTESSGLQQSRAYSAASVESVRVLRLTGRELVSSDKLTHPQQLFVLESQLIVADANDSSMVSVFDASSGRLLASIGRRGDGPGEFRSVWSFDRVPGVLTDFWVFDVRLRRFTLLSTNSAVSSRPPRRIATLSTGITLVNPTWVAENRIASTGLLASLSRLVFLDSTGRVLGTAGSLPPTPPGVPIAVHQHAFQSTATLNPSRTRIALATRHADRVDFFNRDGKQIGSGRRLFNFEPDYKVATTPYGPTFGATDRLRFGYVAVESTDSQVLALFSGRTMAPDPISAPYGTEVHCFDWKGNFLVAYLLDREVLDIAVDTSGRRLFAIVNDPEPAIFAYALPQ